MQLEIKPFKECKILIVDDDELIRLSLSTLLNTEFQVESVSCGVAALEYCSHTLPDLILLDLSLPDISGLKVCEAIKQRLLLEHIPIIFITSSSDEKIQNQCWLAGANDFISKPIIASTLIHRTKNHLTNKLHLEKLHEYSFIDPLTQLYNRNYLNSEVKNIIDQSKRDKKPFSLLMIDIDDFKSYNDHFGHIKGDESLKAIANVIKKELKRPQDVAVRFGGDEFLVLLPYTDSLGLAKICDNLKSKLSDCNLTHPQSTYGKITVSIGAVLFEKFSFLSMESMISLADENLYKTKNSGKNYFQITKI